MEFARLGWPVDEPRLRLDYRRFSYAGKFVTGNTGIAVVRGDPPERYRTDTPVDALGSLPDGLDDSAFDDGIIAAVAFTVDRTEPNTLWLRYLTVRADLRGSGLRLGPRLAVFITEQAAEKGYETARIAVNNVFSYHALYKSGFSYTGRETGLAELVLERPTEKPATVSTSSYHAGLDQFRQREGLSNAETSFLAAHTDATPPEVVAADSGVSNPRRSSE